MTVEARPSRGEVWEVDLGTTRGHEQAGRRPGLVVSTDPFNHGPAGLVVVLPMTTRAKGIPLHVEVDPPEGGVREKSFVKPEDIRSVSRERLRARRGRVSPSTLAGVERMLRVLLEL
jgi:mRNA interferase MazF